MHIINAMCFLFYYYKMQWLNNVNIQSQIIKGVFGSALDKIDYDRIDSDIIDFVRIDFERIDLCLDTIM